MQQGKGQYVFCSTFHDGKMGKWETFQITQVKVKYIKYNITFWTLKSTISSIPKLIFTIDLEQNPKFSLRVYFLHLVQLTLHKNTTKILKWI
jgi:hypothetical protein